MFPVKYELGFYIPEDGILHMELFSDVKDFQFIQCHYVTNN
jgi:hypothetical protein